MTDEELKKLAREYAESACPSDDYPDIKDCEDDRFVEYDFALPVLRWLHKRIVRQKDKAIIELAQSIRVRDREAWQLSEVPLMDFDSEEADNAFRVFGFNFICKRKIVVRVFPYDNEESRILARNEAEELVDTLKGRWSCVG